MVVNDRLRKGSRPRRSTKILHCALYFQLSSRCLIWWLNTYASHALCITSHLILAWKVLGLFLQHVFFWRGRGEGIRDICTIAKVNLILYHITAGNVTIPARNICLPCRSRPSSLFNIYLYKMTKIVRALWLAEGSVCMGVCKHGCGVKKFCFSLPNQASTNLKKFSSSKLEKFTLFTHSFVGWDLENLYKQAVSISFFRLSWHLSEKTPYFMRILESIFLQNKNRLRVQDFVYKTLRLVRIYLLISAITKSLACFLGNVILLKQ